MKLKKLKRLDLSFNYIKKIPNEFLSELGALETLEMSGNDLGPDVEMIEPDGGKTTHSSQLICCQEKRYLKCCVSKKQVINSFDFLCVGGENKSWISLLLQLGAGNFLSYIKLTIDLYLFSR